MDRFNKLSRGMQIMLVGSVLLLISTFFAWQIDFGDLGLVDAQRVARTRLRDGLAHDRSDRVARRAACRR